MLAPRASLATYPGVALLSHGDLALLVWSGEPTLEANRWVVTQALAAQATSKYRSWLFLQIMTPSCGTPGPEARQYVQDAFKTHLTNVRRVIMVPLGDSIRQTIQRTIMRGIVVVSGKSSVVTISASVSEALASVHAASSPDTPGRREVLADIQTCFDTLGVQEKLPAA